MSTLSRRPLHTGSVSKGRNQMRDHQRSKGSGEAEQKCMSYARVASVQTTAQHKENAKQTATPQGYSTKESIACGRQVKKWQCQE